MDITLMKAKPYSKELVVAKALALKAGKIMLAYADDNQNVTIKSDNSPVTIADTLINDLVIKELNKKFPQDGVIGEEKSTTEYGMGRKWLCDPIDGTAAYIWGTPTAMFSLALVVDGRPVLGVTFDPFLKKLYWAVTGQGSFCNQTKLSVSPKGLHEGFVAVTGSTTLLPTLPYLSTLRKEGARLAMFSGAAYKSCLIARGRFVGYIEHGVNPYDVAAIQVIIEEAGGKVTNLKGKPHDYSKYFKGVVASNGKVHDRLVEIIT